MRATEARSYNFSREQESYMRSVRLKNLGFFQRESMMGYPGAGGGGGGGGGKGPAASVVRDVESGCMFSSSPPPTPP